MVIDTSALIAILVGEPDSDRLLQKMAEDPRRLLSVVSLVETSAVIEARRGEPAGRELDLLLHRAGVKVVEVDAEQAELARFAYRRYGKGNHPAGLNLGDCFTYALARVSGEPVLAQGTEFGRAGLAVCA